MMRITFDSEWHAKRAVIVFLYLFQSSGLAHLDCEPIMGAVPVAGASLVWGSSIAAMVAAVVAWGCASSHVAWGAAQCSSSSSRQMNEKGNRGWAGDGARAIHAYVSMGIKQIAHSSQ